MLDAEFPVQFEKRMLRDARSLQWDNYMVLAGDVFRDSSDEALRFALR